MAKRLTAGEKRAARRFKGAGKKAGFAKNLWLKRQRQVRRADRKK